MALTIPSYLSPPLKSLKLISRKGFVSVASRSSSSFYKIIKMVDDYGKKKLMEYPHLSIPHRDLMVDLVTRIETRLGSQLLPCTVPPDVAYYQNQSGTSQGTLQIRCGNHSSHIDFVLASWLHLELPTGGAMDITNLQGYMKSSTDAPHFQLELVQCSPTYWILFIDLTPRKDLVLHPDYLKTFYEDTQLVQHKLKLNTKLVPEMIPYFSSSLYFNCVVSPTGILVTIECAEERAHEIIRDHVSEVAKEILEIWMDKCVSGDAQVIGEAERDVLERRDFLIKSRAVEMDLRSNMPKQFGQEVADRVLRVIGDVFKINGEN